MTPHEQLALLNNAQTWFRNTIMRNHLVNTAKLKKAKKLDINPFLAPYLAVFMTGELTSESIAKALTYPRALGSSINTSFGQNMQKYISKEMFNAPGSLIPGIDIEFNDCIDGRKKYCQVKLGPNTINKDDVKSIHGHFTAVRNLGRTNGVSVRLDDMVVGILYGKAGQESSHYKKLSTEHNYSLFIGKDFWHRLTGAVDFYDRLIQAISEVAQEAKGEQALSDVATELAKDPLILVLASTAKSRDI